MPLKREGTPTTGMYPAVLPQHRKSGTTETYEITDGSNNALHSKIVDQNGVPYDATNPVPTTLTGSNVKKVTIADSVALTDTNYTYVTVKLDGRIANTLDFTSTLDVDVTIQIIPSEPAGSPGVFYMNGTGETSINVPPTGGVNQHQLITDKDLSVLNSGLLDCQIRYAAATTPSSGSVSLWLYKKS